MATFTASEINPLKGVHVGENIVRSRYTGSLTVSEVLLLARIPNKAVVMDWMISGGNPASASTGTWKIGCPASPAVIDAIRGISLTDDSIHTGVSITSSGYGGAFVVSNYSVSASIIVSSRAPAIVPFKISLSDDAVPQYVWMQALYTAGSFTGTHSINFVVKYVVGEP